MDMFAEDTFQMLKKQKNTWKQNKFRCLLLNNYLIFTKFVSNKIFNDENRK